MTFGFNRVAARASRTWEYKRARRRAALMGTVMITCPNTGRPISTNMEKDQSAFNRMRSSLVAHSAHL